MREYNGKNLFYKLSLALTTLLMSPACVFAASIDEKIDKYFAPFSDAFSKVVFFPVEISGVKIPLVILFLFNFKHYSYFLF